MKTAEEIKRDNPINRVIESYGIELKPKGSELACICPFHDDSTPSLRVNVNKNLWHCDPCGKGGSSIDFVKYKDGIDTAAAMQKLSGERETVSTIPSSKKVVAQYYYKDETGKDIFKVVRFEPKDFRQCHVDANGKVVWNMDGVRRVLYNLPKVLKTKSDVWIVEGEKDADNLSAMGLVASCNVGGAGKWLDGYSDHLKGKSVIICPDNDKAGEKHLEVVMKAIAGYCKSTCVVRLPKQFKDVSDFLSSFASKEEGFAELMKIKDGCAVTKNPIDIPILSMEEIEESYKDDVKKNQKLNPLGWLRGFRDMRGLTPGDLCTLIADTGVGKSCLLQNMAFNAPHLTFLIFELELPANQMFERFLQMQERVTANAIENSFKSGNPPDWKSKSNLKNIYLCSVAKLTPELIHQYIIKSELKIGKKPDVVIIDYIGLVKGKGKSRYEAISNNAEELKVIAKDTNVIMIASSQVSRNKDSIEINLHDAKDSGSIEASSQLVIGAWRPEPDKVTLKILKSTKDGSGLTVDCLFNVHTLRVENLI